MTLSLYSHLLVNFQSPFTPLPDASLPVIYQSGFFPQNLILSPNAFFAAATTCADDVSSIGLFPGSSGGIFSSGPPFLPISRTGSSPTGLEIQLAGIWVMKSYHQWPILR